MPTVSVIVPARDARATIGTTLDALAGLTPIPGGFEVLVSDDGSTDGTREVALAHPVVDRVVDAGGNGPGAARNTAAAVATGTVFAFTDADCVPDPGWLRAALAAVEAGADLVQGRVDANGPAGAFDRTVRVGQLSGLFETANLVVRREWFERVGGFEPWLSPRYSKELGEDVWLGWRLRRAGASIVFAPDALVRHAVFPRSAADYVKEFYRLRFFPLMTRRIPELRESTFHRKIFLNRRSEAFDLAVLGLVVAVLTGSFWPLAAAIFHTRHVLRDVRSWGRSGHKVAGARIAADFVGLIALIQGSIRARRLLL